MFQNVKICTNQYFESYQIFLTVNNNYKLHILNNWKNAVTITLVICQNVNLFLFMQTKLLLHLSSLKTNICHVPFQDYSARDLGIWQIYPWPAVFSPTASWRALCPCPAHRQCSGRVWPATTRRHWRLWRAGCRRSGRRVPAKAGRRLSSDHSRRAPWKVKNAIATITNWWFWRNGRLRARWVKWINCVKIIQLRVWCI